MLYLRKKSQFDYSDKLRDDLFYGYLISDFSLRELLQFANANGVMHLYDANNDYIPLTYEEFWKFSHFYGVYYVSEYRKNRFV